MKNLILSALLFLAAFSLQAQPQDTLMKQQSITLRPSKMLGVYELDFPVAASVYDKMKLREIDGVRNVEQSPNRFALFFSIEDDYDHQEVLKSIIYKFNNQLFAQIDDSGFGNLPLLEPYFTGTNDEISINSLSGLTATAPLLEVRQEGDSLLFNFYGKSIDETALTFIEQTQMLYGSKIRQYQDEIDSLKTAQLNDKVDILLFMAENRRDENFNNDYYLQYGLWVKLIEEIKAHRDDIRYLRGVIPTALEVAAIPKGGYKSDFNIATDIVREEYGRFVGVIFK